MSYLFINNQRSGSDEKINNIFGDGKSISISMEGQPANTIESALAGKILVC